MTQEDEQLLLVDLCARLPYGVILDVDTTDWKEPQGHIKVKIEGLGILCKDMSLIVNGSYYGKKYKPYLRPMSSMTEEEKEELKSKCIHTETEEDWEGVRCDVWGIQILDKYDTKRWDNPIWPSTINMDAIDWLNKKMFDYRGLIPKGLALEAPEEMYNL